MKQLVICLAALTLAGIGAAGYWFAANSAASPVWLVVWISGVTAIWAAGGMAWYRLRDHLRAASRPMVLPHLHTEKADELDRLREQNELLQNVITRAPAAIILCNREGRITLANPYANKLLHNGKPLEGERFREVLDRHPPELREAIGSPSFVVLDDKAQPHSYHVSSRNVLADSDRYQLHMLRRVTDEVNRQEVEVWKKVIRVFSHELNNSLAPMASLIHSARLVARKDDCHDKLDAIFDTLEERVTHLSDFLASYARFAKLPKPVKKNIDWKPFVAQLQHLTQFHLRSSPPAESGYFDPAQLQQVLLNLIKNAHESGSTAAEVEVDIEPTGRGVTIRVMDRGRGMSEQGLRQAHLPFYSTKRTGTGLGLAVSRDILLAHGGQLQLRNRQGGGLEVTCSLPGEHYPDPADCAEFPD
ncbi:MAG: ATP-binding protein [Proteobacteria bacterium]|nr:ATP-binding protein [Pseudomonadota bacterium]